MTIASSNPRPQRWPLSAMLVAAFALLAGMWALTPASAMAMTDEDGAAECTEELEWSYFELGEECEEEEQGSGGGGSSSAGSSGSSDDSSDDSDDDYYDESGDPCADYGECWDEWNSDDGMEIAEEDHDGRDRTRYDDEVRAMEEAYSRASRRWHDCVALGVEFRQANAILDAAIRADALAGGSDGTSEQIDVWRRTVALAEMEVDTCVSVVNQMLDRVQDERVRLGLPRKDGRLFFKDEDDLDEVLGFKMRKAKASALSPAQTSQAEIPAGQPLSYAGRGVASSQSQNSQLRVRPSTPGRRSRPGQARHPRRGPIRRDAGRSGR